MGTGSCPTCGTARLGAFRYCRSCGLDYDATVANAPDPAPEIPTPEHDAATVEQPPADDADQPPADDADQPPADDVAQPPAGAVELPPAGDVAQPSAGDVIVIQIRQLKLVAGAIAGGLIGSMLAGAIVVPWFGEEGVLLGSVAAIVIIVVSAWLGMRFMLARAKLRPPGGSEGPG